MAFQVAHGHGAGGCRIHVGKCVSVYLIVFTLHFQCRVSVLCMVACGF
jgi:hypothetical protein